MESPEADNEKSPASKKPLLFFALAQTIVLLVFYYPWLSGSATYFFRDLTHYIEPFALFTGEAMSKLRLPLWNPWCYCGMPQMSISVQGICYPPTWLFALMPFSSGLAANMLIHQLVCGLGGFLLVLSLGWGILPATICGTTLAMSGYDFCFSSIFSLVQSSAWCPACIWAIRRLGSAGAKEIAFWTFVSSALICMQLLAGHPELSSIQFAIIFVFLSISGYNDWRATGKVPWQEAGYRLRAVFIGVMLAMPMILPSFEWYRLSRRSSGLDPTEALTLSASWYDILGLVLAQPLGDLQLRWSEFRPFIMKGQMLPYMATAYLGPVVLTLALWSLADKAFKERWLLLAGLIFIILLALGENAGLAPFLLHTTKSALRFPVKVMFFADWCLAIMAARGLYYCIKKEGGIAPYIVSGLCWLVFGVLSLLIFCGQPLLDFALPSTGLNAAQAQTLAKAKHLISTSGLIAAGAGLLVSFLAAACHKPWKNKAISSAFPPFLILLSCSFLLFQAFSYCRSVGPADYFETSSILDDALKDLRKTNCSQVLAPRMLGLYMEHFTVPQTLLPQDSKQATVRTYQYSRQMLRANTNIDFNQSSSFGFEGTCTGDFYYFVNNCYARSSQAFGEDLRKADDEPLARFCQASATGFVITQIYRFGKTPKEVENVPFLDKNYFEHVHENQGLNARIYAVKNDLPRAYFASNWRLCQSHEEALASMYETKKSGFDPGKMTLVENMSESESLSSLLEKGASKVSGQNAGQDSGEYFSRAGTLVTLNETNPNEMSLEFECNRDGLLVLCDQYYPGWQAELDGQKTDIHIANGFYRAVYAPKGAHKLRFIYQPQSFFGGCIVSALALIWILLIFWQARSREKNA